MAEIANSTKIKVKNLVDYNVGYKIEEDNVRRQFAPYEIKQIEAGELRKLNYTRGGHILLTEYLSVMNRNLADEFGVDSDSFDNEYNWDVNKVDSVLTSEPIEVLQDALDFAPKGVLELIKDRAIALKLDSMDKRQIISSALGIDLSSMIEVQKMNEEEDPDSNAKPKTRRAAKNSENSSGGEKQRRAAKATGTTE